jgi:pimeloyl-ACP methyl ester carboxylesterase
MDPFLVSTDDYIALGFASPEHYRATFGESFELGSASWVQRERNREMTTRIAWRPRMYDQSLPYRLPYVTTPTLVIWGESDRVVPRNGVERYRDTIPGAELVTVPAAGHMVECEALERVADLISSFTAHHAAATGDVRHDSGGN